MTSLSLLASRTVHDCIFAKKKKKKKKKKTNGKETKNNNSVNAPSDVDVSSRTEIPHLDQRERSGLVVECLTRDRRAAGSSLTGVTALWSLSKTHLS